MLAGLHGLVHKTGESQCAVSVAVYCICICRHRRWSWLTQIHKTAESQCAVSVADILYNVYVGTEDRESWLGWLSS